jgi:hypothetical protein
MDPELKQYLDSLTPDQLPWNRMFSAYGNADNFGELLKEMAETADFDQWNRCFRGLSDMEHQSTLCPPAPFVTAFLLRILERELQRTERSAIAETMLGVFPYYLDICHEAERTYHAAPLPHLWDLLDERYLLPEGVSEEELEEFFEDPDSVPETLWYSFYYYTKAVLAEVPELLDRYGKYPEINAVLKQKLTDT